MDCSRGSLPVAKKCIKDPKAKLIERERKRERERERERESAVIALESVERQAEGQRVLLRNAEEQLVASREQILALKKKLKEV